MPNFETVKQYLQNLDLPVIEEDAPEELVVVRDEEAGISRLVIDCEAPLLILEQHILNVPTDPGDLYKRLLQMNRTLVHGAFVLDGVLTRRRQRLTDHERAAHASSTVASPDSL